jgi:carbon starvation protein
MGKGKYALVTAVPGLFMIPVTFSAGYLNIVTNYMPKGLYLLVFLTAILMFLTAIISIEAFKKWYELIQIHNKLLNGSGRMPIKFNQGESCEQPKI